jgi:hypothetical protein
MDDSNKMKALIPLLLVLVLISGHDDPRTVVNLIPGKDEYNLGHNCDEGSPDLEDYIIRKNDYFDKYDILLNTVDEGKCFTLLVCDICCRLDFYRIVSEIGTTEVEYLISDGKGYDEMIVIAVSWDKESQEVEPVEGCPN